MHVGAELCQPSHFNIGAGIVGSVRREYSSVTMVGVQEHELGEDLCVPVSDVNARDIHLPVIGIILIGDGENREGKEVRELEGHGLPVRLGAVGFW